MFTTLSQDLQNKVNSPLFPAPCPENSPTQGSVVAALGLLRVAPGCPHTLGRGSCAGGRGSPAAGRVSLVQVPQQPGLGRAAGGGVGRGAREERPGLMVQVKMLSRLFVHFILLPISLCHPYLVPWFAFHASIIYISAEQHLREEVSDADFADKLGTPMSVTSASLCSCSSVQKREEVVGHEQHKSSRLWGLAWGASFVLRET